MENIQKYLKNKEILQFSPVISVKNKVIKVTFINLEKKYERALSELTDSLIKEALQVLNQKYSKLNDDVKKELGESVDEDLKNYMTVLLNYGENAFNEVVNGTIIIKKNKVFYNNLNFDAENTQWLYNKQPVKI